MFVPNKTDKDHLLKAWSELLSPEKLDLLKKSKGYKFYELIFRHIKEEDFRCLYSSNWSCPNSPVNCLLSALIICEQHNWSHAELESQLAFNIEIRVALGLDDLESSPFSMRTFYNFKNRLSSYEQDTGINLVEQVFTDLTKQQLSALNLNTSIQRGDSVLLESSIRNYSRIALLVEVLRRLYLILSATDQESYHFLFEPYLKGGEKFVYSLSPADKPSQLVALGQVYYTLNKLLADSYENQRAFHTFARVYGDHFVEQVPAATEPAATEPAATEPAATEPATTEPAATEPAATEPATTEPATTEPATTEPATTEPATTEPATTIVVKVRTGNLGSNTLQSPDDLEATFRSKRKESHHGFVAFGAETCHPDNEINLVTALSVDTNNTDDSTLLEDKIDDMVELTPKLKEFHQDGGFGSEAIDKIAAKAGITIIQTAVRGKNAAVPISIKGDEKRGFSVTCPNEEQATILATKSIKNYKATFDLTICQSCPLKDQCPAFKHQSPKKGITTFYFPAQAALMQERHEAIHTIPKERQTLRSGVEGLMGQMHRGAKHTGKLKVRGLFNTKLYVFAMGIAINFERIYNWLFDKNAVSSLCSSFFRFFQSLSSLLIPQSYKNPIAK